MKLTKLLLLVALGVASWTVGFAAPTGESDASGSVYGSEDDIEAEPVATPSVARARRTSLPGTPSSRVRGRESDEVGSGRQVRQKVVELEVPTGGVGGGPPVVAQVIGKKAGVSKRVRPPRVAPQVPGWAQELVYPRVSVCRQWSDFLIGLGGGHLDSEGLFRPGFLRALNSQSSKFLNFAQVEAAEAVCNQRRERAMTNVASRVETQRRKFFEHGRQHYLADSSLQKMWEMMETEYRSAWTKQVEEDADVLMCGILESLAEVFGHPPEDCRHPKFPPRDEEDEGDGGSGPYWGGFSGGNGGGNGTAV